MSNARLGRLALLVVLAALVAAAWWRTASREDGGPDATPPVASAPPPAAAATPARGAPARPARPPRDAAAPATQKPAADAGGEDGGLERALRWSSVDLDALREELPDNLYWEMGAPTSDPAVIEARERERARWNEAWGQVLSGNASEADIHAYYEHRQQLSSDYLAFATRLLDEYRDVLPERDVGLLELSVRMHHKRLQELPRDLAQALERKQRQDALREAWLRDEARLAEPANGSD
ncbi:MAG TPA: hypothetical protein VKB65_07255 [Myxococcota bacterium]|nr:hypothetical protein [Myxococcota bacterium]